jgi:fumarate reductase subunit C
MATVATEATPSSTNRIRFRFTFNFGMALLMAAIVTYGFSQTIGDNLIHPSIPRPRLLYVHAVVMGTWLSIYILQTGLVASRNVKLHQRLGLIWITVGVVLPPIGVATGILMRRFDVIHFHDYVTFISVILWDMVAFSTLFLLAVLWRKRPEYHRRFMFLATCGLMNAGFARLPLIGLPPLGSGPNFWADFRAFYAGVIVLILIAITRDLIVQRRVHIVYRVAVPLIVAGQVLAVALSDLPPAFWTTLSHRIVGV